MPDARDLTPASTPSARILCVDDDPFMRRALNTMLRNRGFTTLLADSAGGAMAILRSERIDIVLTDQQMPGLSGLDLMRTMRAEGFSTPVILITGAGSLELAVTAVRAGAVHFLTKPVDPHELQQLITDILEAPLAAPVRVPEITPRDAGLTVGDSAAVASEPDVPRQRLADYPPGTEVLVLPSLDVAEAERRLILRALERTMDNRAAAAALLGMHPRTLRRKMRDMQITPPKAAPSDD